MRKILKERRPHELWFLYSLTTTIMQINLFTWRHLKVYYATHSHKTETSIFGLSKARNRPEDVSENWHMHTDIYMYVTL